jgi:acyl-CoA thioester hydrolase
MMKNGLSYETSRVVTTDDIDDLNHVNNAVYVKWMDDVAYAHWSHLTTAYNLPECIWVVVRHEIDYKAQALLNDKITIKTWVGETSGIKSIRHIVFYKEETLLVQSKTTWVFLDVQTQKPTRITESVLKILEAGK